MAQAYFFNLTATDITLNVNSNTGTAAQTVSALPKPPYTPNNNPNAITRHAGTPQTNQFGDNQNGGTANTVSWGPADGSSSTVTVTVAVDHASYPIQGAGADLLIYLFTSAAIVMSPTDSIPYLGTNGQTINVKRGSAEAL
jgi:hypothetical protein